MTTATQTTRQVTLAEANSKKALALKAYKAGDKALCSSFLKQAADRYRAAGNIAWAKWCEQRIG